MEFDTIAFFGVCVGKNGSPKTSHYTADKKHDLKHTKIKGRQNQQALNCDVRANPPPPSVVAVQPALTCKTKQHNMYI